MQIEDVRRLKLTLEEEYKKNVEALDRVIGILEKSEDNQHSLPMDMLDDRPIMSSSRHSKKIVSDVVREMPQKFNTRALKDILALKGVLLTRASVNQQLKHLMANGHIKLIEKGAGRRPAVYEKITL